jgi:hypothetical protein
MADGRVGGVPSLSAMSPATVDRGFNVLSVEGLDWDISCAIERDHPEWLPEYSSGLGSPGPPPPESRILSNLSIEFDRGWTEVACRFERSIP